MDLLAAECHLKQLDDFGMWLSLNDRGQHLSGEFFTLIVICLSACHNFDIWKYDFTTSHGKFGSRMSIESIERLWQVALFRTWSSIHQVLHLQHEVRCCWSSRSKSPPLLLTSCYQNLPGASSQPWCGHCAADQ